MRRYPTPVPLLVVICPKIWRRRNRRWLSRSTEEAAPLLGKLPSLCGVLQMRELLSIESDVVQFLDRQRRVSKRHPTADVAEHEVHKRNLHSSMLRKADVERRLKRSWELLDDPLVMRSELVVLAVVPCEQT